MSFENDHHEWNPVLVWENLFPFDLNGFTMDTTSSQSFLFLLFSLHYHFTQASTSLQQPESLLLKSESVKG